MRGIMFFVLVFFLSACSVIYSFQSRRLNRNLAKTITIHEFQVRKSIPYISLSQILDRALCNRFVEQAHLIRVDNNGDIDIKGEIIDYKIQGMVVKDNYESIIRLTIIVRVKYINHKEANIDVDQIFSASQEFNSACPLSEVEDELISRIIDELTDKIYNETVAKW